MGRVLVAISDANQLVWLSLLRVYVRASHVEGKPGSTNLVKMPANLFSHMTALSKLHLGTHPSLTVLPSFEGLTNLKSLTLAALGVTELPPFDPLEKIERLEIISNFRIVRVPSLAPLERLNYLVISRVGACCNGSTPTCNGAVCASKVCVVGYRADQATVAILEKFNSTICAPTPTTPGAITSSPYSSGIWTPAMIANIVMCGGVLYRQCSQSGSSTNITNQGTSMCYNYKMQVIACSANPMSIAIRKVQIQRSAGLPCNPVEEKWLECPDKV